MNPYNFRKWLDEAIKATELEMELHKHNIKINKTLLEIGGIEMIEL